MGEAPATDSSVVLYEGSPLERISSSSVFPSVTHSKHFVYKEIVMGQYGTAGFLIIDTRPDKRQLNYNGDDGYGLCGYYSEQEHGIDHPPYFVSFNPERKDHFIGTEKGFSMVRNFILPPSLVDFVNSERLIGEPIVDKAVMTLPAEFDEVKGYGFYVFSDAEGERLLDLVIACLKPKIAEVDPKV